MNINEFNHNYNDILNSLKTYTKEFRRNINDFVNHNNSTYIFTNDFDLIMYRNTDFTTIKNTTNYIYFKYYNMHIEIDFVSASSSEINSAYIIDGDTNIRTMIDIDFYNIETFENLISLNNQFSSTNVNLSSVVLTVLKTIIECKNIFNEKIYIPRIFISTESDIYNQVSDLLSKIYYTYQSLKD